MRLPLTTLRNFFLILAIAVFSAGIGYTFGSQQLNINVGPIKIDRTVPPGKPTDFSLFWRAWDELYRLYVDREHLDQQRLIYGAIQGMIGAAGDPYTVFLPPVENKEIKENLEGSFGGVGIQLGFKDHTLAVIAPLAGTPADKAGIRPGDLILKITDPVKKTDRETEGISLPEAVNLIRGPRGTGVTLTIFRSGSDKPFTTTLIRDTIVVKTVELKISEAKCKGSKGKEENCKIPLLKVSSFGEKTDEEWDRAVDEVLALRKSQPVPGIILDLRNDSGGFLDQAVNLGSDFITSGPIVWQQFASGQKTSLSVTRSARLSGIKLVVLINQGSASAAEILAGALSERAGATLVGEKSFGKGSVQQPEDLPGGSGLHITVAKWLLPSGKSIDKVGISPNVEVKNDPKDETNDLQFKKAVEILTKG